jgi:hypothetical protein
MGWFVCRPCVRTPWDLGEIPSHHPTRLKGQHIDNLGLWLMQEPVKLTESVIFKRVPAGNRIEEKQPPSLSAIEYDIRPLPSLMVGIDT